MVWLWKIVVQCPQSRFRWRSGLKRPWLSWSQRGDTRKRADLVRFHDPFSKRKENGNHMYVCSYRRTYDGLFYLGATFEYRCKPQEMLQSSCTSKASWKYYKRGLLLMYQNRYAVPSGWGFVQGQTMKVWRRQGQLKHDLIWIRVEFNWFWSNRWYGYNAWSMNKRGKRGCQYMVADNSARYLKAWRPRTAAVPLAMAREQDSCHTNEKQQIIKFLIAILIRILTHRIGDT